MSIDEVSRELGRLAAAMEAMQKEFSEHKTDESKWQISMQTSLDNLIAMENQRKGMLQQAKNAARIWGAALGAVVVGCIEIIKQWVFGA